MVSNKKAPPGAGLFFVQEIAPFNPALYPQFPKLDIEQ